MAQWFFIQAIGWKVTQKENIYELSHFLTWRQPMIFLWMKKWNTNGLLAKMTQKVSSH